MQIAGRSVSENDSVIAMPREELLKIERAVRQLIRRETYIFKDQGCAARARTANRRKQSVTNGPVLGCQVSISRECSRFQKRESIQHRLRRLGSFFEFCRRGLSELHEKRCCFSR